MRPGRRRGGRPSCGRRPAPGTSSRDGRNFAPAVRASRSFRRVDTLSKTAFLFPGQGAQAVGMGREIYDSVPAAKELFDRAGDILGYDLAGLCFRGPAETQPLSPGVPVLRYGLRFCKRP